MARAAGRFIALEVGLLLAWLAFGHAPARAGDEAPTDAEVTRRLKRLKSRALDWWQARQRLTSVCIQCRGRGEVLWGRRGWVKCPKCDGHKRYVDADRWRLLYYEMRSPAFRLQEGIRDRLEDEFRRVRATDWPTIIKKFRIAEVVLADPCHGVAHVEENDDRTARPQNWIWLEERGKGDWFLWEEQADGAWVVEVPRRRAPAETIRRVLEVTYDRSLPKEKTLLWRLTVRVETPVNPEPATLVPSGLWLDFVLAASRDVTGWRVSSHGPGEATIQVGGVLEHDLSPEVFVFTPEQWQKDILVRLVPSDGPPAPGVEGRPSEAPSPGSEPAPPPEVQSPQPDSVESLAVVEKWRMEREEHKARMDEFRQRLPELDAVPEKSDRARAFLDEADRWLGEASTAADRLAEGLERDGGTLPLPERSLVNVLLFKVHRNLEMMRDLMPSPR